MSCTSGIARGDLVEADDRAHLVVQDLRGGAGQRGEARHAQAPQVLRQRLAQRGGALPHFESGEGMEVQVGERFAHGAADVHVEGAGEPG